MLTATDAAKREFLVAQHGGVRCVTFVLSVETESIDVFGVVRAGASEGTERGAAPRVCACVRSQGR
jgi:hypothetical protein